MDDRELVQHAVSRLSSVLVDDATIDSVMELVIAMAVASIDAGDAASVSVLAGNGQRFETMSSTSPEVVELDGVQYDTGQGPCVSATRESRVVVIDVTHDSPDWPEFVSAARDHGVTSVFSSPLPVRGETIGALNLYSHRPGAMEEWDGDLISTFAASAAVVLANTKAFATAAEQNVQLQSALVTRELIGRAKGVLMERHGIGDDEAFDRLRVTSQHENRKLRDVAEDVVASVGG